MWDIFSSIRRIERYNFRSTVSLAKRTSLGWILFGLVSLFSLLNPNMHYNVGNIFFGGVPTLYNLKLAEFFLTYASYPILGDAPAFAHHQLSRVHFIRGDLDTSLQEAYKEIDLYPDHWNTHYIIGLTLGYMNREVEAIDAFGKFIEHKPGSWAARNDRAWLQFRIGDIDGALTTILPVASSTSNAWVQNTYGTLLMNKKRNEEAREAFLHAQRVSDTMTAESWGMAYPGNDPRIYETGLKAMRASIENNLSLLSQMEEEAVD